MTAISDEQFISTIYDRLLIEDDTEESVSGSDYHLAAIVALYDVLLRYAQHAMKRWYVTAEVLVLVDVPDRVRNPWRAMPDVYVVRDTPDTFRTSLDTRTGEAFPQFLCEVASDSTWDRDIVEKQRVYADLGAREYLVCDPTTEFLGQSLRAWRRAPTGAWAPWELEEQGFLTSTALDGLRLRAEGTLLRVYDPMGERLPTARELDGIARERAARLVETERAAQAQAARLVETEQVNQAQSTQLAEIEQINQAQAARLAETEQINQAQVARLVETEQVNQAQAARLAQLEEELALMRTREQQG